MGCLLPHGITPLLGGVVRNRGLEQVRHWELLGGKLGVLGTGYEQSWKALREGSELNDTRITWVWDVHRVWDGMVSTYYASRVCFEGNCEHLPCV